MRDALLYWVFIPAIVICGGKAIDILLGLSTFAEIDIVLVPGSLLITAGSIFIFQSMKDLLEFGRSTVNPLSPPKELVKQGAYRICRHPMFLGYDIAALGIVMFFRSPGMLFISYPLFIAYETCFLIKEEKILALRFRDAFKEYRERVSFLIPIKFTGDK